MQDIKNREMGLIKEDWNKRDKWKKKIR